jgi:uncharacterized protein (DUF305 family)
MRKSLLFTIATASAAGMITLAGCSGSSSGSATDQGSSSRPSAMATGTPAAGPHNDADIAFASGMVPHHAQAIEMADMAIDKGGNAKVLALAKDIKAAQGPEIAQMNGWLVGWGQPAPTGPMAGDMPGMDHGGMMSAADMKALGAASGAGFDRMWVQMMIQHHEGAVAMARTELSSGQSGDAKALAQLIITGQTAEITVMKQLLGTL